MRRTLARSRLPTFRAVVSLGRGEINNARIAETVREIGYQGTVGLETWAAVDSELALERFRTAFSVAR